MAMLSTVAAAAKENSGLTVAKDGARAASAVAERSSSMAPPPAIRPEAAAPALNRSQETAARPVPPALVKHCGGRDYGSLPCRPRVVARETPLQGGMAQPALPPGIG
jgi:hypothetical protein